MGDQLDLFDRPEECGAEHGELRCTREPARPGYHFDARRGEHFKLATWPHLEDRCDDDA